METSTIFYKKKLFWGVCGIPTLLSCFYLFVWAAPRYESMAIVRVYEAGESAQSGGESAMEGMSGASLSPGSQVLVKYVASWDAFQALDPKKLKKHWSSGDLISSFGGPLSLFSSNQMWLWNYYKWHVKAHLDEETGLITLNVDSYSSDFSWNLNKAVLKLAQEELVQSGIKADQAERSMLLAKLEQDKILLSNDLEKISELQRKAGISDLKSDYQAVLSELSIAEKERIAIDTRAAATAFLANRGQQIETLRVQLAALDKEIEKQRKDIARKSGLYKEYGEVEDQVKRDSKIIMLDDQSLLLNDQNSVRHAYYMDYIEHPVHPTDSTRPLALKWTLIILVVSFILYLIVK